MLLAIVRSVQSTCVYVEAVVMFATVRLLAREVAENE